MKRVFEYKIDKKYDGMMIKMFLKKHYQMSSNLITDLKKYFDGICVNGVHQRVTYILKLNDIITITMYEGESENIIPVNIPIDVIYEDEDIAVINKSINMPTHPSIGNYENSLANGLLYYWKQKGENHVFRAVNRLDKDTSGVMLVAKNAYSHARLCDQMSRGIFRRKYRAIVCGSLKEGATINAPIRRLDGSAIQRCVAEDGQEAITHFEVIKEFGKYTLIELELDTGRTHQIRVHMSHIGFPILGDWLYGTEDHSLFQRQALHSSWAGFCHPVTGKEMMVYQAIPKDMEDFIINYREHI